MSGFRLECESLSLVPKLRLGTSAFRRDLLQFSQPDVAPGDFVRPHSLADAVYLQANEAGRMIFVDLFVSQVFDCLAVDPSLNPRPFGDDAELVPFAVLEVLVWLESLFCGQPTELGGLAIDVARFGTFRTASFDLDLRAVDATELLVAFGSLSLRANLDSRVQLVGVLHFEFQFEVGVVSRRAEERIRATFVCLAHNRAVLDAIRRGAVLLNPTGQRLTVEEFDPTVFVSAGAGTVSRPASKLSTARLRVFIEGSPRRMRGSRKGEAAIECGSTLRVEFTTRSVVPQ